MQLKEIILASIDGCTGCMACRFVCPKSAIIVESDQEGFLRPKISQELCIRCGCCEGACPVLHRPVQKQAQKCYVARAKSKSLRLACSSGGISELVAKRVLAEGGVVFGCVMEKNTNVAIHCKIDTDELLERMRGSKYVQSDLRETFGEVRLELEKGHRVLFIGTPCQIAGLKRCVRTNSQNLLTMTFMCHGVPSPAVWNKYLKEVQSRFRSQIKRISFRSKNYSWRRCALVLEFSKTRANLIQEKSKNTYLRAFLSDLCLRPSCYACQFKNGYSGADITLADCWGVSGVAPELDDDTGTSLLLLHSECAQALFEELEPVIETKEITFEKMIEANRAYLDSPKQPISRGVFMATFRLCKLERLVRRLLDGPWYICCLRKLYYGTRSSLGTLYRKFRG